VEEVDRLTLPEYRLLMKATSYKMVDMDYRAHQQAFLNFAAQSKKRVGKDKEKPVYSNFKKFFDYEAELAKIDKKDQELDRFAALKQYMREERKDG